MVDSGHQCGPQYRPAGAVCWDTVRWYIAGMLSGNFAEYLRNERATRAERFPRHAR
jgi:hypothetical protein